MAGQVAMAARLIGLLFTTCCIIFTLPPVDAHVHGHDNLQTSGEDPAVDIGRPLIEQFDSDMEYFQVRTPKSDKKYMYIWLVTENKHLRLRIKAKKGAHIALAQTPKDPKGAYEVIIGRGQGGEQKMEILDTVDGTVVASKPTPGSLSPDEFRPFWITWENSTIRAGFGSEFGVKEAVSWSPTGQFNDVTAVSMDTWTQADVFWQFSRDSARDLYIWSRSDNNNKFSNSHINSNIWFSQPVRQHFVFGARGCAEAHIGLGDGKGFGDAQTHKAHVIILGTGDNNDESVIKAELDSSKPALKVSTPDILSCTQTRFFWVSWESGYVQVGKGLLVGNNMFLNWLPPKPHEIKSVTPFFNVDSDSEFHFRSVQENYYLLKSQTTFNVTKSHMVNVEQRTSFVFQIRACYNAVINLHRKYAEHTAGTPQHIRFILGTSESKGQKSIVRFMWDDNTGDVFHTMDSPNISKCYSFQYLWIAWHEAFMRVGKGAVPYENQLFQLKDPYLPFSIETLQLGSLQDPVDWQFSRSQAKGMEIYTNNNAGYPVAWLTVAERKDFVFKVKGGRGESVELMLATYVGNNYISMYTVRISSLTVSTHRTGIWREKDTAGGSYTATAAILSGEHLKSFWVSWTRATIVLGQGVDIGQEVITTFRDSSQGPQLEINAVCVSSSAEAVWQIDAEEGPQLTVYTPKRGSPVYDTYWMVPTNYIFPFKVKAENLAYIALSDTPGNSTDDSIEIKISFDGNTEIHMKSTGERVSKATPGIINKHELSPLWVSWFNDTMTVGQGLPMQNIVVSLPLNRTPTVSGIGLSSGVAAEWKFSTEMATEFRMQTHTHLKYNQLWMDTGSRTSQVFRVKAEKEANIILAQVSEVTRHNVYEVTIGRKDNQFTSIRKGNHFLESDNNVKATKNTPDVLSSSKMRTFWVSWSLGEIQVGHGAEVGASVITSWLDPEAHPVHALSISTDMGATGVWELYRFKGEIYHIASSPNAFVGPVMTSHNDHVSFSLWGCSPAAVILLEDLLPTPDGFNLYEVSIGRKDNSQVGIYRKEELTWKALAEKTYSDLIQCGVRTTFWVGWKNKLLQLGRGVYPNNILLEYDDKSKDPVPVNAFSFSNAREPMDINDASAIVNAAYPIHWELDQGAVTSLRQVTHGPKTYNDMWMTVYSQDYLMFTMKTCSTAFISLSQISGVTTVKAYEIKVMLASLSIKFFIYSEGNLEASGMSANFWNCKKTDQAYWIRWAKGKIEIGHEMVLGSHRQLSWTDKNPHEVNFLGFASDITTVWNFYHLQGNVYGHSTRSVSDGDQPSFQDLWMVPLRHVTSVSFKVMGCFSAHIALCEEGNSVEKAYEVVLGDRLSEGVYLSSIRHSVGGASHANRTTNKLLDCRHERLFWVRWKGGHIEVGQGAVGSFPLMDWKVPLLLQRPVRAVSFGSGGTVVIKWHFIVEDAEAVHAITVDKPNDNKRLWRSVRGQDRLVFQVRTCARAVIWLTDILYETRSETYMIELATDLKRARIIDIPKGSSIADFPIADLVSCSEYRTFWVQWSQRELLVGRGGFIGHGVILQATFAAGARYPINSVGFDGWDSNAQWGLLRTQGEVYRTSSSPDRTPEVATIILNYRHEYSFTVRACANAHVLLWVSKSDWRADSLSLGIGVNDNTLVELHFVGLPKPVVAIKTPEILSCTQHRRFWISWKSGKIRFGKGVVGSHEVFAWTYMIDGKQGHFLPKGLEFTTFGNTGEWELDQTIPMETCEKRFRLISNSSEGLSSDCSLVGVEANLGLLVCLERTCALGGNTINFWNTTCEMLRCANPDDRQLANKKAPANVFALFIPRDTFIAKTSRQLGLNYDQHWVSVTGYTSITFKVKACAEVHLALSAVPGNSGTLTYEIVIGGWGNTHSAIRTRAGVLADPVVRVATPGVLACATFRHLWVSWAGGVLEAGQGRLVGAEPFIEYEAPSADRPLVVNAVGLSSAVEVAGMFMFGDVTDIEDPKFMQKDETYFMRTGRFKGFKSHRWSISKSYLLFNVMTSSSAQILLAETPSDDQQGAYLIHIGSDNNMKTSITDLSDDSHKVVNDTPGVLDKTTMQAFWVEWSNELITVGKGRARGLNVLTQFKGKMPEKFYEVAVATPENQEGLWKVNKSEGHVFKFFTPDTRAYTELARTTRAKDYMVFRVAACTDAHILLGADTEKTKTDFEVVIGGNRNTKIDIRPCPGCQTDVTAWTPGIIDCKQLRPFWLRWHQGLELGSGTKVGQLSLLRLHEATSRKINFFNIMTGWGSTGRWHFSDINGDGFYMRVPPAPTFQDIWLYQQNHYFRFSVRSCQSAHVYLGETPFISGNSTLGYEIHINGANEPSQILKYPLVSGQNPVKVNASTPAVVNCDAFATLWVSWADGIIQVGYGELLKNEFMYYRDEKTFPIRGLSIRTPDTQKSDSEWQFDRDAGKIIIFNTHNGEPFLDWLTMDTVQFTYMRVATTQDAEILLSSSPGVIYGHKIILGRNGADSALFAPGESQPVTVKKGNPLAKTGETWFWLSWVNNTIAIGLGFDLGYDVILSYDMDFEGKQFDIEAIGFRTTHSLGVWEFSQMESKEFEVSTAKADGYKHVWLFTTQPSLHFKVKACKNVKIALAEHTMEGNLAGHTSYELILGDKDNKKIEFWKYTPGGTNEKTLLDSKPLTPSNGPSCEFFKQMWLTWRMIDEKKEFQMGIGPELYMNEFYKVVDPDSPYNISTIGFASDNSKVAKWVFKDDAAAVTRFHTDTFYNYDKILYHVATMKSFVFRVKAKQDAHLVLYKQYHANRYYEFVIGMSSNTYTVIREKRLGKPVAYRETKGILSKDEYRQFWISWNHNRLAIGYGNVVGRREIVGHDTTLIPFIQYLSMSTWDKVSGEWEYMPQRYNTLLLNTPAAYPDNATMYLIMGELRKEFMFEVRACADAKVHLLEEASTKAKYKLIIGAEGNTNTRLYKDGTMVHEQTIPDVLHCSENRKFWMTWKDGHFVVAKGSEAGIRILEWDDSSFSTVHTLTLATGPDHDGSWSIPRYQASQVRYDAREGRRVDGFWMTVTELTSYSVSIKAKSSAQILLTDVPGSTSREAYEILIGSTTQLKNLRTGAIVASVSTPKILLQYEHRWFWVSWSSDDQSRRGQIRFGKGPLPGQYQVLSGTLNTSLDINALGFLDNERTNITWELSTQTEGNIYILKTDGIWYNDSAWITPRDKTLSFEVQACRNARVALLSAKSGLAGGYELQLGLFDNTGAALLHGLEENGGQEIASVSGRGWVNCYERKRFWVTWDNSHLRVGEGYTDEPAFLTYKSKGKLDRINVVGFSSDSISKAEWRIPQDQENTLDLTTKSFGAFGQHWITVVDMDRFVFRVKACQAAKVLLVGNPGDTINTIELAIGADGKTYLIGSDGAIKASVDTPDVLDCDHFRSFWIHWRRDRLYVGRGTHVYLHSLLRYENANLHDIQALSVTTGGLDPQHKAGLSESTRKGDWQIFGLRGNTIKVFTPAKFGFEALDMFPPKRRQFHVTFRVRSCDTVHYLMAPEIGNGKELYDVAFGTYDNRRYEVLKGDQMVASSSSSIDILSENQYRPFWVSYHGGNITAGRGELGRYHEISHYDSKALPRYVTAFTSSDECPGSWDIDQRIGDVIQVHTKGHHLYNEIHIMTMDTYYFTFEVKASHSAHIALSGVPTITHVETWEIGLQTGISHNKNYIRDKLIGGADIAKSTKGNLLDKTTYRTFWISWANKRIAIGEGLITGQKELMGASVEDIPDFASVAFSTALGIPADWLFKVEDALKEDKDEPSFKQKDETYLIKTDGSGKFKSHRWSISKSYFMFDVIAKSDAQILLEETPGDMITGAYLIHIGSENNMKTAINDLSNINRKIIVDTPNILNGTEPKAFWVEWTTNSITVGTGTVHGLNILATLTGSMPQKFNEMAVTTSSDRDGFWTVAKSEGHVFKFTTPDTGKYWEVWRTTETKNYIVFKVAACNDANILLSPGFDEVHDTYEVTIGAKKNTYTYIRPCRGCPPLVSATTHDILICGRMQAFWIRWDQGIEVGQPACEVNTTRPHELSTRFLWFVDCWSFTSWQHLRSYQDGYRLVTVHTDGGFIVLPYWETQPPAP